MDKTKLETFLKEYTEELKSDMDWSEVAPCYAEAPMHIGRVYVRDKNGDVMAVFLSKNTTPSCPITQRDIQAAKLLMEVINYLGKTA